MIFIKVGGWMKLIRNLNKKRAFTLVESIIYIFICTILFIEEINVITLLYNNYLNNLRIKSNYDNLQNFYIELDNMFLQGNTDNILCKDDLIELYSNRKKLGLKKEIKIVENKVKVIYFRNDYLITINNMMENVEKLKVFKKGNLIYYKLSDCDGGNFISCL